MSGPPALAPGTRPRCTRPECARPLRQRGDTGGWARNRFGWCMTCDKAWHKAGCPEGGPPAPRPASERTRQANGTRRAYAEIAAALVPQALLAVVDQAVCKTVDPDLFFPVPGGRPWQVAAAKEVCAECPVARQCGDYAMAHGLEGVWGGMTEDERRQARRREAERRLAARKAG